MTAQLREGAGHGVSHHKLGVCSHCLSEGLAPGEQVPTKESGEFLREAANELGYQGTAEADRGRGRVISGSGSSSTKTCMRKGVKRVESYGVAVGSGRGDRTR